MTSTSKTLEQRNEFLKTHFDTCPHCQHRRIEFNQKWNKRINKQRELYQKQQFPDLYQKVCSCLISEIL